MTEKEFHAGIAILQGGCGKNYRETTLPVWWEALKDEYAGAYLSICRELAKSEERLPPLSAVMDRLNELKHTDTPEKRLERDQDYYAEVSARASEYERVVGDSFANFLSICQGDHTLAGYYFGKAYWKARGVTKYDAVYDQLIDRRERFLANPKKAGEEAAKQKKKEIAERIEMGRAMDAAAGYVEVDASPSPPPAEHSTKSPVAAPTATTAPPEDFEFSEENLPF